MSISALQEFTFYFLIYSLAGWLLENVYSWFIDDLFWKVGFLKGPFKPMYGFAPLFLSLTLTRHLHWIIILILSLLIPTTIEYVSGVILHSLFQKRWWDYSTQSLQLHGHICMKFSLYWCPLSLVCLYGLHPWVINLYTHMLPLWNWLIPILSLSMLADVIWSSYSWRSISKNILTTS
ncbi:putative ABC transporter permease [Paenibacillus glacialis]|uniref:ABC transporter permease n=1 Tax=Paenibacillus glacialis TaxID=494026 RepID=A0A168NNH6_9BACL|nr:putative ABC transporter permease [Paenibacillus glacialis]OAB45966.1 hypothetical protein PGLA_00790 [Paenibacillus glacialis]